MCLGRVEREAADEAARIGSPVRRAEADESRHEVDAVAVRHPRGERRGIGGVADHAEAVAQPLDRGARDEDRSFHRVGRAAADPVGGCRQHLVARAHGHIAGC
jgi:hypothetical protein